MPPAWPFTFQGLLANIMYDYQETGSLEFRALASRLGIRMTLLLKGPANCDVHIPLGSVRPLCFENLMLDRNLHTAHINHSRHVIIHSRSYRTCCLLPMKPP